MALALKAALTFDFKLIFIFSALAQLVLSAL
jgi:hypothetical protein